MGGAVLGKSLIQFSIEGKGCVLSLLFDLRPNYGGGNEDNGDLLQKGPCRHCLTQYPWPCSRPPTTHASARDSWTLTGKSGSVYLGHCSFLLGAGAQHSVCSFQESISPILCKFWQLYGEVNGDLLQEGLCHTHVCCPMRQATADPYLHRRH